MCAELEGVDWRNVTNALTVNGWARLAGVVDASKCALLAEAAPSRWNPVPEIEGAGVRQAGLSCGCFFEDAHVIVRDFGKLICDSVSEEGPSGAPLPHFNEVQWARKDNGRGFITPHRDPPGAGGVIAITTLSGRAAFRVWNDGADPRRSDKDSALFTEWETGDGDVVILCGSGWPEADSRCPVHEVEDVGIDDRLTMTLRYNKGGAGAAYFKRAPGVDYPAG